MQGTIINCCQKQLYKCTKQIGIRKEDRITMILGMIWIICKTCQMIFSNKMARMCMIIVWQPTPSKNKQMHISKPTEPNLAEQILIILAFTRVTPYDKSSKRLKEITEAITYHLCKNMLTALQSASKDWYKVLTKNTKSHHTWIFHQEKCMRNAKHVLN